MYMYYVWYVYVLCMICMCVCVCLCLNYVRPKMRLCVIAVVEQGEPGKPGPRGEAVSLILSLFNISKAPAFNTNTIEKINMVVNRLKADLYTLHCISCLNTDSSKLVKRKIIFAYIIYSKYKCFFCINISQKWGTINKYITQCKMYAFSVFLGCWTWWTNCKCHLFYMITKRQWVEWGVLFGCATQRFKFNTCLYRDNQDQEDFRASWEKWDPLWVALQLFFMYCFKNKMADFVLNTLLS